MPTFAPQNTLPAARMVESVDTRDLKSLGHCGCVGSSPTPGTKKTVDQTIGGLLFYSDKANRNNNLAEIRGN